MIGSTYPMPNYVLNSNIKRIIFHVGLHKTGTSTIQHVLYSSADELLTHGVLYPVSWVSPMKGAAQHNHFLYLLFKNKLSFYLQDIQHTPEQAMQDREAGIIRLEEEFRTTTADTVIISSENLSLYHVSDLQNIYDYFSARFDAQIEIHLYFRHYLDWTRSLVQQLVKQRHSYDNAWDHIKRRSAVIYIKAYDQFVEVFGVENVYAHTYEHLLQAQDGIVAQFLLDVRIDVPLLHSATVRRNESVSHIAADICSFINEREPRLLENDAVNPQRKLGDLKQVRSILGPKFDIPITMKMQVNEYFASYADVLRTKFDINYKPIPIESTVMQSDYDFDDVFVKSVVDAYQKSNTVVKSYIIKYFEDLLLSNKYLTASELTQLLHQLRSAGDLQEYGDLHE
jgi:hypothetical protein